MILPLISKTWKGYIHCFIIPGNYKMRLTVFVVCIWWIALPCECYQCPPPALRTRYASEFCPNDLSLYHCLWNTLIDDYSDVCLRPEVSYTPGSYVVYSNALNARRCPTDRYQPFAYSTNDLNECIYEKSNCTEEGQIPAKEGTFTTDATCKCDYTRGYSYTILPAYPCLCKPSTEDCSCYLTPCLNKTHKLSPDYICEQINEDKIRQYQCPRVKHKPKKNGQHEDRYNSTRDEYKDNVIRKPVDTVLAAGIVTSLVFLMVLVFIVVSAAVLVFADTDSVSTLQAVKDRSFKLYDKIMQEVTVRDTHTFNLAKEVTEKNQITILKGRKGTGKTTLAIHLASVYRNKNYKLAILGKSDRNILTDIQRSSGKFVIILEEWFDILVTDAEGFKLQTDFLGSHKFQNQFKVMITTSHLDETLRINRIMTEHNVVYLDKESQEHTQDSELIMRCLLKKYNKELPNDAIKEAAETYTYYGFPLQCVLFCQDSRNFELGSKYFRQPPEELMKIINRMKKSEKYEDKLMYCILVYITLNPLVGLPRKNLDMEDISCIFEQIHKVKRNLSENDVQEVCSQLSSEDLLTGNNVYFVPPVVYQAVMLTYAETDLDRIIDKCDLTHILDLVRPLTYEMLEGEVVLIIDRKKNKYADDILAKRMAQACLDDETVIPKIVHFMRKCKYTHILQKTTEHLQTKLKTLTTEKRIENVIILMTEISSRENFALLEYTPTSFVLAWALIALQKSKEYDLMKKIIERHISYGKKTFVVEILRTVVDQHNNSFLHYCVLWWYNKANPFIQYLGNEFTTYFDDWVKHTEKIFEVVNEHEMSAADFVAYFGNHILLHIFMKLKYKIAITQSFPAGKVSKLRREADRLLHRIDSGKANNVIEQYSRCPFINMNVCGPIDMNDTFDFDKAVEVLTSLKDNSGSA